MDKCLLMAGVRLLEGKVRVETDRHVRSLSICRREADTDTEGLWKRRMSETAVQSRPWTIWKPLLEQANHFIRMNHENAGINEGKKTPLRCFHTRIVNVYIELQC